MFGGDFVFDTVARSFWELVRGERPRWRLMPTLGEGPTGRSGCSAVYDERRDRVLVFGGRDDWPNQGTNDLWSLSLSGTPEWKLLLAGDNTAPAPRAGASLILDSRDRLVLYGGDGAGSCDTTVWLLTLGEEPLAWRSVALPGPGPGPRARHGAVYSPVTNRVTIIGGDRPCEDWIDPPLCWSTLWELALSEPMRWIEHPEEPGPVPQTGGPFVADPEGTTAWLVPGDQGPKEMDPSVWRRDLVAGTWSRTTMGPIGPEFRAGAAACVIPSTGELLLHGGARYLLGGRGQSTTSETWSFLENDPQRWHLAVQPAGFGRTTTDVRAHFDARTRKLITWGYGGVQTMDLRDDAWTLEPASDENVPLQPEAMSVLDPSRRRLLVFGGLDGGWDRPAPASQIWVWPLDGGAWTTQPIQGRGPKAAIGSQCVYDDLRDRVLVLPSTTWYGDTHEPLDSLAVLDLQGAEPRWSRLAIEGTPPTGRAYGSVVFDRDRDRLILQGGLVPGLDGYHPQDLWALSLAGTPTWTRLAEYHLLDKFATSAGLVIDPTLERLMVIGGLGRSFFGSGGYNSIMSMSLFDALPSWTDLDPAETSPMRGSGTAVFDPMQERVLFWNQSLWEITWSFGTPERLGSANAHADQAGVHVSWPGPVVAPYVANVERSIDGGLTWLRVATAVPSTDGTIAITDADPAPLSNNIYRVLIERGGELKIIGTAALGSAPGLLSGAGLSGLVLAPVRPNPATDDVTIELASPVATQVTLEVFDLSGRRVGAAIHRDVAAGSVAFTMPLARGLKPGLYLLRASDGRRTVKSRLAVVR